MFRFTKMSSLPNCQVYQIVRFTKLSGLPIVRFTKFSGLPNCQVYQSVRFTKLSGLPNCQVYQIFRFARLSGLPNCQVYQIVRSKPLFDQLGRYRRFFWILKRDKIYNFILIVSAAEIHKSVIVKKNKDIAIFFCSDLKGWIRHVTFLMKDYLKSWWTVS